MATAVLVAVLALSGLALLVEAGGLFAPAEQATPASPARPETLEEQLTRVATDIEQIRDLAFEQIPAPTYLPVDELAERAAGLAEDYSESDADTDRRVLVALGAIPSDSDLRALLSGVLGEQVAGFYDPKTEEMVVGRAERGERLGPSEEVILAHELVHALTDQAIGLPDTDDDAHGDAALAASALVEGDAMLAMVQYADEHLSAIDRFRMLGEDIGGVAGMTEFDDLPHVLQRSLLFAYEEGLRFVVALHGYGGWEAVNDAYARLPSSTLQILEPERYLAGTGAGIDPTDPSPPGSAWQRRDRMTLGAADLLFLFEAPGDDRDRALEDPGAAARRWLGGEIVLWTRGQDSVVGLSLVGRDGLCGAITTWYAQAFPDANREDVQGGASWAGFDGATQDAVVRCAAGNEQEIRVGIAPDLDIAIAVVR